MQPQPNLAFDTLGYAKKLQSAGFTQQQAEVQAQTFLAIVQEQLVSKRDLKELEVKMETKIELVRRDIKELEVKMTRNIKELESETKIKIEALEVNLTGQNELLRRDLKVRMGSMLVVSVVALSGVMGFLSHLIAHAH